MTLRVWNKNNQVGITSTSDLTSEGIKKAMKGAIEASIFGNEKDSPQFSSLAKQEIGEMKQNINTGVQQSQTQNQHQITPQIQTTRY